MQTLIVQMTRKLFSFGRHFQTVTPKSAPTPPTTTANNLQTCFIIVR